jgi:hypothetical protein
MNLEKGPRRSAPTRDGGLDATLSVPGDQTRPGGESDIDALPGGPPGDRLENRRGIGPFPAAELGVEHLAAEGDLEGRPPPGLQIHADPAGEPVCDRLPETSGLGEVVSNLAVLDRDHGGPSWTLRTHGRHSP